MSWYNLLFCSNYHFNRNDEYAESAVQKGLKFAATINVPIGFDLEKFRLSLPKECDAVLINEDYLFIFHKGKLSDYYDLVEIKELYQKHNIWNIDWKKVEEYFSHPISDFADKTKTFNLNSSQPGAETVVTGLLLGYPIESTVSFLRPLQH